MSRPWMKSHQKFVQTRSCPHPFESEHLPTAGLSGTQRKWRTSTFPSASPSWWGLWSSWRKPLAKGFEYRRRRIRTRHKRYRGRQANWLQSNQKSIGWQWNTLVWWPLTDRAVYPPSDHISSVQPVPHHSRREEWSKRSKKKPRLYLWRRRWSFLGGRAFC